MRAEGEVDMLMAAALRLTLVISSLFLPFRGFAALADSAETKDRASIIGCWNWQNDRGRPNIDGFKSIHELCFHSDGRTREVSIGAESMMGGEELLSWKLIDPRTISISGDHCKMAIPSTETIILSGCRYYEGVWRNECHKISDYDLSCGK